MTAGVAYPADYSATYSGPQYTANQGRTALAAAMGGASATRPLGGISGVRPGTPSTTVTATSTTWTASAFGGYIDTAASATNGGYYFSFPSGGTGSVTAAAASARIDIIYVQLSDVNTGDGTTVAPKVDVLYLAGTAGSGVPPTTPARSFVVAQINVPASGGGSPTVSWTAPYTMASGGRRLNNNSTELTAWNDAPRGQGSFLLPENRPYSRVVTGAAPSGAWLPERAVFVARRQNTQTFGASGWQGLSAAFGTADINDLGTWTSSTGTLQVTHAGIYRVGLNVRLASTSNPMAIQITQNSTNPDVGVIAEEFINSSAQSLSASGVAVLAAGDAVRGLVYTSVANSIDTTNQRGLQMTVELLALQ